jgi:UDP-N-acetylglucosamine---dolichyl-phosphate N-acetylglucosaminyltransferase
MKYSPDNELTKNTLARVAVVIPAHDESKVIQSVIQDVKEHGFSTIIVVDDGSADDTFQKAKQAGAKVLRHKLNRGKGAGTKTGIEAAKQLNADIIVTMDGDGQHEAKDIHKMIRLIKNSHYDVVLGNRLHYKDSMPKHKLVANYIANFFTWIIYGLWVQDSQSGLRAYSKHAASLIQTTSSKYEFDSEVIREIRKHKLKYCEVPITVRYTEYSMGKKHRQSLTNGIKTLYKMLWNRLA